VGTHLFQHLVREVAQRELAARSRAVRHFAGAGGCRGELRESEQKNAPGTGPSRPCFVFALFFQYIFDYESPSRVVVLVAAPPFF
jgi:hypothetical protein